MTNTMEDTPRSAQIAHVLFLDIVGYSKQSTSAQGRLTDAVSASPAFGAVSGLHRMKHTAIHPPLGPRRPSID